MFPSPQKLINRTNQQKQTVSTTRTTSLSCWGDPSCPFVVLYEMETIVSLCIRNSRSCCKRYWIYDNARGALVNNTTLDSRLPPKGTTSSGSLLAIGHEEKGSPFPGSRWSDAVAGTL